jgi:hypothetical protein
VTQNRLQALALVDRATAPTSDVQSPIADTKVRTQAAIFELSNHEPADAGGMQQEPEAGTSKLPQRTLARVTLEYGSLNLLGGMPETLDALAGHGESAKLG